MTTKKYGKKILGIFTLVFIISACSSGVEKGSEENQDPVAESKKEAIRTMKIDYQTISRSISYPANLQAFKEIHLAPASPGRIEKIYVEAGDKIKEGQVLVDMDKTQLRQAEVQLQSLETDYRRMDTLQKAESIPQQQFDQVRTQYEVLQSNVRFLRENTRLTAPFNGKVSGKYFENGEMYSAMPNTPAGKAAILSIVQTDKLKALVNISEIYFPNITMGMAVHFTSDVYPGESFEGRISSIYPTIDPATRSFTVEVITPNPGDKLRPGMFARAKINLDKVQAFVVPSIAVLKLQGANDRYVFIEKNGFASRIVVELGERYDDQVEIISDDIRQGDMLVIAGQSRLIDGMEVTVNE